MSTMLLAQLRHTLKRLTGQSTTLYSAPEQQELREMLSSTIKALHKLYPDDLSMPQQFQLLQNLTVLEQQFIAILPDNDAGLTSWQTLHRSLRTTIETTLANEAIAHRSKI